MDETDLENASDLPIGERLRMAREAKGLSLDEVAGQTRIPVRHLQHIESGDWDALPAITYSVGFVRSYGNAVGLDGGALGQELRQQLGGARRAGPAAEYYEPADPARVPPRWLAIAAAVIAALLIGGYLLFRSSLDDGAETVAQTEPKAAPAQPAPGPSPPPGRLPPDCRVLTSGSSGTESAPPTAVSALSKLEPPSVTWASSSEVAGSLGSGLVLIARL